MTKARVILVSFPNLELAKRIAKELLERNYVKCVNLLPGAESLFLWEGIIQEEREVVALFKLTAEKIPAFKAELHALHTYDVPEFIVLEVEQGSEAYLKWLGSSD